MFKRQKAIDRLDDRLRRLEDLCADLERSSRKLELEFTELYDKVRHQLSRMAKRDALAAKSNGLDPEPDQATSHLDSLDPISRSIMLRRARVSRGDDT